MNIFTLKFLIIFFSTVIEVCHFEVFHSLGLKPTMNLVDVWKPSKSTDCKQKSLALFEPLTTVKLGYNEFTFF
jgi:hypothetical protein